MHIQNGISEALTVSISINAQLFFSIFMLLLQGMGFGWFGFFFYICMLIQHLKYPSPQTVCMVIKYNEKERDLWLKH